MSKRHDLDPAALATAVTSGAVERYEKLGRIGEGTYGVVRAAVQRGTAQRSASAQRLTELLRP